MKKNTDQIYCIVNYFHYEATGKPIDCRKCVMDCKYSEANGGDNNDKSTD